MLPTLSPLTRLYPTNPDHHGQPQWILYHPVSNKYFKIGWTEFEIISRLHKFNDAADLLNNIETTTHLKISSDDFESILKFLYLNGMIEGATADIENDAKKPWWKRLMHGYLYFTIPLFKPQNFLNNTISYVRPLLGRQCAVLMLTILFGAIIATLPRIDEFFNSFTHILTLEGIILTTCVYTVIKIFHELAHAYTATKYGVPVPHMGLAFIVLYPIFYTEATGAWRITDKRARINIGLAGVMVELYIAAIALIAWHFSEPGLGQMIAFSTVAISLIGSLFINLNPLMRFDGYYILSDATDIENMHSTAIDYARHSMRKNVLGLHDNLPHDYPTKTANLLTYFGFAILIYRFFLFLGIAVLVYALFFKPLGLILMAFELVWFIALPIAKELKIWLERYPDFKEKKRFKFSLLIFAIAIIITLIPFKQTLNIPAASHASLYNVAYAPESSDIKKIHVKNGDWVNKGDLLLSLTSDKLEYDLALSRQKLDLLKLTAQRERRDFETFRENQSLTDQEIETAQITYKTLQKKATQLEITAEFDGTITDMDDDLRVGQTVNPSRPLLRIINPKNNIVTAYIRESDSNRVQIGSIGWFRPIDSLSNKKQVKVTRIEDVNIDTIQYPSLASPYHGSIPAQTTADGIKPLVSLYKITLEIVENGDDSTTATYITPGQIIIGEKTTALITRLINKTARTFRTEISFN